MNFLQSEDFEGFDLPTETIEKVMQLANGRHAEQLAKVEQRSAHVIECEKAALQIKQQVGNSIQEDVLLPVLERKKELFFQKYTPEQGENGQQIWRNAKGEIMRSVARDLSPMTTAELFTHECQALLKNGGPASSSEQGGQVLNLRGVPNQVEADARIRQYLKAQGLAPGSVEFQKQHAELREKHQVRSLPIQ